MGIRARTGLELLLVLEGAKPGDFIRKNHKKYSNIKKILSTIDKIGIIEREEMLLYYNFNKLNDETIEKVKNIRSFDLKSDILLDESQFSEMTYILGHFFGYPRCCMDAYLKNETLSLYRPFTEHLWCNDDCASSIKIQEMNRNLIRKYYPDYENLFVDFGNLP